MLGFVVPADHWDVLGSLLVQQEGVELERLAELTLLCSRLVRIALFRAVSLSDRLLVRLKCLAFQMLFNLPVKFDEAGRHGGSLVGKQTTELQFDGQIGALVVQVANRERVVFEIVVAVVDCVVGELGDSVRRVDLMEDQAVVVSVFDGNCE